MLPSWWLMEAFRVCTTAFAKRNFSRQSWRLHPRSSSPPGHVNLQAVDEWFKDILRAIPIPWSTTQAFRGMYAGWSGLEKTNSIDGTRVSIPCPSKNCLGCLWVTLFHPRKLCVSTAQTDAGTKLMKKAVEQCHGSQMCIILSTFSEIQVDCDSTHVKSARTKQSLF